MSEKDVPTLSFADLKKLGACPWTKDHLRRMIRKNFRLQPSEDQEPIVGVGERWMDISASWKP